MSEREYRNAAQERGYRVLLALQGHEFMGVTPGELAKGLGISPSNVTRDLAVLVHMGLAEQVPETGRWRLGPKLVQIALSFTTHLERMKSRTAEIEQRFTRTPL